MKRVLILIFSLLLISGVVDAKKVANPDLPRLLVAYPIVEKAWLFKGHDSYHVAYELFLSNLSQETLKLDNLRVTGQNFEKIYNDKELKTMFVLGGESMTEQFKPELKKGQTGIIFVLLNFTSKEEVPEKLENTFIVNFDGTSQNLYAAPISVNFNPPLIIAAPLLGDHWYTPNAISNTNDHRRALLVLDGQMELAQRFAVDWLKFNEKGRLYDGDPQKNSSYYTYGQEAVAVSDGEIVLINDGIEENIPGKAPSNLELNTVMGNYVCLKINDHAYATYAHLIPGSLKVKVGDRVKKGQLLGRVGNSGNSTAPHLHFQITGALHVLKELQAPSPIFANGIPFEIDHYTRQEYTIAKLDKYQLPESIRFGTQVEVQDGVIVNNDLVNFDSGLSHKFVSVVRADFLSDRSAEPEGTFEHVVEGERKELREKMPKYCNEFMGKTTSQRSKRSGATIGSYP